MKHVKLYLTALLFASLAITGCDDNWDTPPLVVPEASIQANTTIEQLKTDYWFDANNGADTIGTKPDGSHYIIKGRVVSSDNAGNIYKKLVIQDSYEEGLGGKTPASLTLSIDANSLYNTYRLGQEIVIDATGMYIGKYAGLQQMGLPENDAQFGMQMSRMPLEYFQAHAQLNGLPEAAKIDTVTVKISDLPTSNDAAGIIAMQSQLVRIDNVSFDDGGKATFAEYQTTVSRNISEENGGSLAVRTSGYANFYNQMLPEGVGSVVGLLSYFNGSWQLELRSADDCIFGDDVEGTESKPYTVEEAIAGQGSKSGWVSGYIVGAVAPGKTTVAGNADIEWKAPFSLPNTLVIAATPTETDYTKCLAIELSQGTDLRNKANLAENPDNLGAPIKLKGTFANVYGMAGITGNNGSSSEFVFNKVVAVGSVENDFDSYAGQANEKGYIDIASNNLVGEGWSMTTVKGNKDWSLRSYQGNVYAFATGYNGSAPFDTWLVSPAISVDKMAEKVMSFSSQVNGYGSTTSKFEVYVMTSNDPNTATLTKLNPAIPEAPASGYSSWVNSGNLDLSKFSGTIYIGFRYSAEKDANYATWCVDNVKIGVKGADVSGNDGSEAKPFSVADVLGGSTGTDVWATGYIVGFVSSLDGTTGSKFTANGAAAQNVLIADSKDEKTASKCLVVSLPSGNIRNAINLKDNAGNLGKKLSVKGDIVDNNLNLKGIKNTSAYKL